MEQGKDGKANKAEPNKIPGIKLSTILSFSFFFIEKKDVEIFIEGILVSRRDRFCQPSS